MEVLNDEIINQPSTNSQNDIKNEVQSHSHSHSNSSESKRSSLLRESSQNLSSAHQLNTNENKKPNPSLDFLIFLSKPLEQSLTEKKVLLRISSQIGDVKMEFDNTIIIPEYNGSLLKIKGKDIHKKRDATQQLLEFIVTNDLDQPKSESRKYEKIEILMMIPNGLVSMVIGTRGKQISNLISESKANIVINQPIYKMTYRTVSISGRPKNVSDAIKNIQQIMEERYNEVSKIEFQCKPLNVKISKTTVKIIVDRDAVERLNSKKQTNIYDLLKNEYNVSLKITQDRKNYQLDRKDYICSFHGTIEEVQAAIIEVTRKIKNEIRTTFDGRKSYTLRMLINKVFVTKLIGAGGCMIQEIANFSKGASIKIMSNKRDEKKSSCQEIPVCIAGSFCSVQDATCIIIEQMECFKNGGPVLRSGKSLHQNIANQFINSIFTTASENENEDDHVYTLRDRFLSSKRNREDNESNEPADEINDISHSQHVHSISPRRSRRHSHSHHSPSARYSNSPSSSSRYHNQSKHYSHKSPTRKPSNYTSKFSYSENGMMKISTDFIVPDHLVSLLIGKNGENVRSIMSKTGAAINFSKEYNDDSKLNTDYGTGRICNLKGTPQQNAIAMQMISEMVIKYESKPSGSRKQK